MLADLSSKKRMFRRVRAAGAIAEAHAYVLVLVFPVPLPPTTYVPVP